MAFQHLIPLLSLLTLLSVFPLDVVLPSFPALATHLNTDASSIALSLSLFISIAALAQLVIGPLSDAYGRKRLLITGLLLASSASLCSVWVESYPAFMLWRGLQALGCGCLVLSHVLIQQHLEGQQRNTARLWMVTLSGVFISLSPLAGAGLQAVWDWPGSFLVFAGLGLTATLLAAHTLPADAVLPDRTLRHAASQYRALLTDSAYLGWTLTGAAAFACHFSFIVMSPLILLEHLGLDAFEFGLAMLGYGLAYLMGGMLASRLQRRMTGQRQALLGMLLVIGAGLMLGIAAWLWPLSIPSVLLPMLLCTTGTTLVRPAAMGLALDRAPETPGTAIALNAMFLLALGGLASGLLSVAPLPPSAALALGLLTLGISGALLIPLIGRRRVNSAGCGLP